jgi:hypothetical protein
MEGLTDGPEIADDEGEALVDGRLGMGMPGQG